MFGSAATQGDVEEQEGVNEAATAITQAPAATTVWVRKCCSTAGRLAASTTASHRPVNGRQGLDHGLLRDGSGMGSLGAKISLGGPPIAPDDEVAGAHITNEQSQAEGGLIEVALAQLPMRQGTAR